MKYLLLAFSLTLFAFTCKKNQDEAIRDYPCQSEELPLASLESQYGCANTKYGMRLNSADSFMVIRDQATFAANVTGNCLPAIDFNAYTLVIGKKQLPNDNTSIEYNASKDCQARKINLTVVIKNNLGLSAPVVTWHCLLPKLTVDEKVAVSVFVQ
jgi:hypothetical protein